MPDLQRQKATKSKPWACQFGVASGARVIGLDGLATDNALDARFYSTAAAARAAGKKLITSCRSLADGDKELGAELYAASIVTPVYMLGGEPPAPRKWERVQTRQQQLSQLAKFCDWAATSLKPESLSRVVWKECKKRLAAEAKAIRSGLTTDPHRNGKNRNGTVWLFRDKTVRRAADLKINEGMLTFDLAKVLVNNSRPDYEYSIQAIDRWLTEVVAPDFHNSNPPLFTRRLSS